MSTAEGVLNKVGLRFWVRLGNCVSKTRTVLTATWPTPVDEEEYAIFCPCLEGLPEAHAALLSILPLHDANAMLTDALSCPTFRGTARRPDYAALCLVDPFRRLDDLFDAVAAAGITGIVNLPSISSFFDPTIADTDVFDAGFAREIAGLVQAKERGFEIAGTAPDQAHSEKLSTIGCGFVLSADGRTIFDPKS